jgi:hypothetical protein
MAIQATDSGAAAQEYTFDPTQGKIVPLEQARVVTYITDNPDGLPSSATTGKTTATAQAAADKKARIELDPDVIAARANQKAAEEEVAATEVYKSLTKESLAETKAFNAENKLSAVESDDSGEDVPVDVADGNPPPRTVKSRVPKYNPINGKLNGYEITYSDGTVEFEAADSGDDETDVTTTTYTAPDGKIFTDLGLYNAYVDKLKLDEKRQRGQSAYEILYEEFDRNGLGSLVKEVEKFIKDGLSKAELTLKLRGTKTYQTRFAANADRINNGYAAVSEAEYLALEDSYQNIMRNYGLPESYYAKSKDGFGTQIGFQKFIANDVSATELEDRVMAGQERVLNSNPEVLAALKSFYPGITNGDVLAYTLDPTNALTEIKRKITSAEIGGAALQAGLKTTLTRADELSQAGITKAVAQQGFETVAGGAPRGGQLASIYGQDPYTQTTAETEVFGLSGKTEAAKQRKKVTGLEKATFGGQSGATSSALVRDRAGAY